ncbi:MAG: ABC transporter substrate-binding protein [Thermodesulfobacteriota bacterium]
MKKDLYLKIKTAVFAVLLLLPAPPDRGAALAGQENRAESPQRIISLGPINTENIYLLGAQDRLIADTIYCNSPPAAREKEKIGTLIQVNIEKIVSLKPDLVLATALTRPRQVARLEALGIRVIRFIQPDSFQEICSQFLKLGRLLDREEKARRIVERARSEVDAVRRQTENLTKKRVFLQVGARPLHASIDSSFTHDFIRFGGGENIAAGASSGIYSREKVIREDPEVIIIAMMGSQTKAGRQEKKAWQRYKSLQAVKNNSIYLVDADLVCSPSPLDFVKALKEITSLIHRQ